MRKRIMIVLACITGIAGCAAPPNNAGTASIEPLAYPASFDHAREVLVDLGFTLNRVDAAAGILTTDPLPARGLAAPWERQQASRRGEIADTIHPQSRTVRIEFVPASTLDAMPSDASPNQVAVSPSPRQLNASTPLVARVTVLIERTYRPNMRPQVVDVVRTRRAFDPAFEPGREFTVVVQRDSDLERRIADRIARAG
ncbi:MAG: hypothetical protein AAFN41_07320 [Planctomycetota bacterium]